MVREEAFSQQFRCVLREFLCVLHSILFVGGFLLHEVHGRSVLECRMVRDGADGLRAHRGRSVIEGAGGSRAIFGQSAAAPRIVRLGHADSPLGACGRSAWCSVEFLGPLVFEFRFHFSIVWGLFLEVVGPL
jgi:hypothetical protein